MFSKTLGINLTLLRCTVPMYQLRKRKKLIFFIIIFGTFEGNVLVLYIYIVLQN